MSDQIFARVRRRIFISYGHDNLMPLAIKIKNDLAALGHEVWFDADNIAAGADWEQYIEEGLDWVSKDESGRVIVLMTPHSVRRPDGFCLNEITRAIARNLKIVPVMLVWCEPPLSICRIQWLDMRDCVPLSEHEEKYRMRFDSLVKALDTDRLDIDGFHQLLSLKLKPLSYDAEIKYSLGRFTGRQWIFDEVDRWMADDGGPRIFWILGGPGTGKTAISAWLCAHRPEIVAFHFCRYDNIQKRDPRLGVTSIVYQLSTQLPQYEERLKRVDVSNIGDLDAKTLFDLLIVQPLSASFPAPDGQIVVLIDALDEATINGQNELACIIAHELEKAPAWLKLIVTSRPTGDVTGILQGYSPYWLDTTDARNERDIREYLQRELKPGPGARADALIDSVARKSEGLFLYAEWAIRELASGRLSADRPDEFPQGLGGIYVKLFQRQFPDLAAWERETRPALEVITAAMEPIATKQLAAILGWNAYQERRFRSSTGSLFTFDGPVTPFHKTLVDWLTNEEKDDPYFISASEGHRIIADYSLKEYAAGRRTPYIISHLPEHLLKASEIAKLKTVMADLDFIGDAWAADKFRLMGLWASIEGGSDLRIRDLYGAIDVGDHVGDSKGLLAVTDLLRLTAHFDLALRILDPLAARFREKRMLKELSECLSQQAWILSATSETQKALAASIEQESVCRSLGDVPGLVLSLHNQAYACYNTGDYDRLLTKSREMERLARSTGNLPGVERALNLQAAVLIERDYDYGRSLELLKETERIDRESGFMSRLSTCLTNQGECMRLLGRYDEALTLYKEAEQISRRLGDRQVLGLPILNQGIVLLAQGRLDEAEAALDGAKKIFSDISMKPGVALAEVYIGRALYRKGRPDEAMAHYLESETISRAIDFKVGLQECLGSQAVAFADRGDRDRALALLREQEKICAGIGLKKELEACLRQQQSLNIL